MTPDPRPRQAPLHGASRGIGLPHLGIAALIMLVAASCYVAIRAAGTAAPPLRFAALRLLIGGATLLPFAPLAREPLLPPRPLWGWLAVLALASGAFAYGAMFVSPNLAGAGLASVLGNAQPLLVIALAAWLLQERPRARDWAALALGLAGLALVTAPALTGPHALRIENGAALALASSLALAVGTIIVKRLGPTAPLLTLTAWQLLLGGAALLALSAATEAGTPIHWTPRFLAILLYLALAGTTFVTLTWYRLLAHHHAGMLSLLFFLVPAFGLALASILLGEPVTIPQALGATLVVASAAATAAWRSPAATPTTPAGRGRTPSTPAATPPRSTP